MNVDVRKLEKNYLEIALIGQDVSLADNLREIVNEDKDVEFASARLDHPEVGHPVIIIRTKSKDALEVLIHAVDELKTKADEFKTALKDSKKAK